MHFKQVLRTFGQCLEKVALALEHDLEPHEISYLLQQHEPSCSENQGTKFNGWDPHEKRVKDVVTCDMNGSIKEVKVVDCRVIKLEAIQQAVETANVLLSIGKVITEKG